MLDETFSESVIHRRAPRHARLRGLSGHIVLGRRLRPFTFWHAHALDVLLAENPRTLVTLDLAVRICRSVWPQMPRLSPGVASETLTAWRFSRRLQEELAAFKAYLDDYRSGPIYGRTENSSPCKCPWYLLATRDLRRNDPRLTEKQAWMTELGYGSWLNAAHAELRRDPIDILTPELRKEFLEAGYTEEDL